MHFRILTPKFTLNYSKDKNLATILCLLILSLIQHHCKSLTMHCHKGWEITCMQGPLILTSSKLELTIVVQLIRAKRRNKEYNASYTVWVLYSK